MRPTKPVEFKTSKMKLSKKLQSITLFQSEIGPPGWFFESLKKMKEKYCYQYTHSRFKLSNSSKSRTHDDVYKSFEDIESFEVNKNMWRSQKNVSSKPLIEMERFQYFSESRKIMTKKLLMLTFINFLTDSSVEHI